MTKSRPCESFGPEYVFVTDSKELESITEYHGATIHNVLGEAITGAMVLTARGDYEELWATTSPAPYSNSATYYAIV